MIESLTQDSFIDRESGLRKSGVLIRDKTTQERKDGSRGCSPSSTQYLLSEI